MAGLPEPYYNDGGITIYHGDCADVLPHVDPADVGLLLTDPPYGIGYRQDGRTGTYRKPNGRVYRARSIAHEGIAGDDRPFDPALMLSYGRVVLWGANHFASKLPDGGSWIVWDRKYGSDSANTNPDAELAWASTPGTVRVFRHLWDGFTRASEQKWHVHPTQKPVALMRWIVDRWTKPGELVLDPYMGSGPVARACADLGRRYIGVELVEDYCKAAVSRLAQQALDLGDLGGAA